MILPDPIAKVRIPEEGSKEDKPYHRFFISVFHTGGSGGKPLEFNDKYIKEGEIYVPPGIWVQAKKTGGYIGHVYEYDKERVDKGKILASVRIENKFGQRFYVVDIYAQSFLADVRARWGDRDIEIIKELKEKAKKQPPAMVSR